MNAGNRTWLGPIGVIAIAVALTAAACGSDEGTEAARLDPAVAERLASSSEAVAASLDSGDACGAAQAADDLAAEVSAAELPEQLRSEAEGAAAQLVNTVNCGPEPEQQRGEGGDEGRGEGEGDGGDSAGPGAGPPGQGGELPPGWQKNGKDVSGGGFD